VGGLSKLPLSLLNTGYEAQLCEPGGFESRESGANAFHEATVRPKKCVLGEVVRIGWFAAREVEMGEVAVAGLGEELGEDFEEAFGEERAWGGAALWHRAHEALLRLAVTRRARLRGGAVALASWAVERSPAARVCVVSRVRRRLFGYGPRLVQEKLRVAGALEELPVLSAELERGTMSFSAVRELTRVATAATERAWLDAAHGRSIREIEGLVSGQKPGNLPQDARDADAMRHVLRLELSGEALATFREAIAKMRREAGEALDEDAAILLLCRQALEGPRDDGRSSYQVALTVCEHCRRGMQQGRGELIGVSAELIEMAACDGQNVGHVGDAGHPHVGEPEAGRAHVGDTRQAHVGEEGHAHVGASLPRATQAIPPALRRRVMRRDGGHCRVPGCRHAVFVDVHHLQPRSEGGRNTIENLVTLCSAHHRTIHRGQLVAEALPSGRLAFRHANGTPYGALPAPHSTELCTKAFRALTLMGYRAPEAKRALARVPESSPASLEHLIRRALRELGAARV
jgi:hypothetical protein